MDDFPRFNLDDDVALVTGASRRPGRAISLASLAASPITGHTVLIDGGWTAR